MNTELTHKQIESAKKSSYNRFVNFIHEDTTQRYVNTYVRAYGIDWEKKQGYYIIRNDKRDLENYITMTYDDLVYRNILTPILRRYYENR